MSDYENNSLADDIFLFILSHRTRDMSLRDSAKISAGSSLRCLR